MEKPDDKLQELMKALADAINHVFSGNEDIKETLSMIEREGYHIDLILASVARVSKKDKEEDWLHDTEVSAFDKSFLRRVRLKFDEEV